MIARLKQRSEFLRVARTQKKWVTPGLIIQVRHHSPQDDKNSEHPLLRIGFTVSRKVGNAVQRNRAKRRLRAIVEDLMPRHALHGFDYVVIGRRGTLNRSFRALEDDMRKALKKLGTYQDTPHDLDTVQA
jgi:ribonuclease P protein component